MKRLLSTIFLCILCINIHAAPVKIDDAQEFCVLNRFFKLMFEHSEYGYVLDGAKPVSLMDIFPFGNLIAPQSLNFKIDTCAREVINVWEHICPQQTNFVLKATEIQVDGSSSPVYELLFVNVSKLKEVIESNINLFRYVLGPTIDTEQLVKHILTSKDSLYATLRKDSVLTGIVLGFGPYNSLMHSRAEELQNALMAKDEPPFKSNSDLMDHQGGIAQWDEIQLKAVFLSQGNEELSAEHANTLKSGLQFSNLQDELNAILSQRDNVPITLSKDKPRFVFGAYKHVDNQRMISMLEDSQRKTKKLLNRPDFLAYVLEKITGEKPLVTCAFSEAPSNKLALQEKAESLVAETIWMIGNQLDVETMPEFVDAFCRSDPSEITRGMTHAVPGALEGLKRAKLNLQFADAWFATMPKAKNLKEIIPGSLYFEPVTVGEGKKVDSRDQLLVSYTVEDQYSNILTVCHHKWVKLTTTIPGFTYGVQGMQEGETRTLYIHPSLAYGALTTLPSCSSLIIKITLHQIDENYSAHLPPLKTIDLAWINDPNFYQEIENANCQMARSFGSRWGTWIKQSSDLDFVKICDHLKRFSDVNKNNLKHSYSSEKRKTREHICNRVFWNLVSQ